MADETTGFIIVGLILLALVAVALIGNFVAWYGEFSKELSVINAEIKRNTGNERKRWQRRKRRLLLSFLPFVK